MGRAQVEERVVYVKQHEEETKRYNAQKEEYRSGDTYAVEKRNKKVLKAKIRQIEEDMNKPLFVGGIHPFCLFMVEKRDLLKGHRLGFPHASKMWQAMGDEQRLEYQSKWSKLKAEWQTDVAKWEEKSKDNPKMAELKAYKGMLKRAKTQIETTGDK